MDFGQIVFLVLVDTTGQVRIESVLSRCIHRWMYLYQRRYGCISYAIFGDLRQKVIGHGLLNHYLIPYIRSQTFYSFHPLPSPFEPSTYQSTLYFPPLISSHSALLY